MTKKGAWERLATYEDTGLEPEEVQIVAEMFAGDPYVPILQASNLVKAYREGRVEISQPNDPLTLEELREIYSVEELDGCSSLPVWIECKRHTPYSCNWTGYDVISVHGCTIISAWERFLSMQEYGDTWLAYRRKPEDVEKEEAFKKIGGIDREIKMLNSAIKNCICPVCGGLGIKYYYADAAGSMGERICTACKGTGMKI